MRIDTTNFGELEIKDNQVIDFPEGIPGFEDQREFVLLNNYDTEEPVPFMWLQSTRDPELALVVAIPFFLRPDYEVDIPDDVLSTLDIKEPKEVGVYSVVKIQDAVEEMTFNLMSPIVINSRNRKGCQIVQDDSQWKVNETFKKS